MNYKAITTTTFKNIKEVIINTEINGKYKTVNKYYVNGKLVNKHERCLAQLEIDNASETVVTFVSNFPNHTI